MTNQPTIMKNGIYHNYPKPDYYAPHTGDRSIMRVSKSMLTNFVPNPAAWLLAPEREYTRAMKFGNLVDCMALTPQSFETEYSILPEFYPCTPTKKDLRTEKPWNAAANFCKDLQEEIELAGKQAVKTNDWMEARKAVENLKAFRPYAELMEGAHTQSAMFGDLIDEGIATPAKSLLDILPTHAKWKHCIADMKTTAEMSEQHFAKTVNKFGYHRQAAIYLDLHNAITGEDRDTFYIVWVHSKAPYEVAMRPISASAIAEGRRWYRNALRIWNECVTTGVFPSPWDDITKPIDLPAFAELTGLDENEDEE
jgi:hypothetical protein